MGAVVRRPMRALFAIALLSSALVAGCSGDSPEGGLRAAYGDENVRKLSDFLPPGTALPGNVTDFIIITGDNLEGRVGNGTWSATVTQTATNTINGPTMAAPAPAGGGGESTALTVPATSIELRLLHADALAGFNVGWIAVTEGAMPGSIGSFAATGPATDAVMLDLPLGTTRFGAALYEGEPSTQTMPYAAFTGEVRATLGAEFTITGEVQPFNPDPVNAGVPVASPRDAQVDKYTFSLANGGTITAATIHTGGPTDGADVDLGLVEGGNTPVLCSASGTGVADPLPDPNQSIESLSADVGAGDYSVEVGFLLGPCPTTTGTTSTGFYYLNVAPVPYQLTITIA